MGQLSSLGEFEQIVLLAVARLGDTYGMAIRREILARAGRDVAIGAVYATLDRLETKGLLKGRHDRSGGRAKRFFALTAAGVQALEASRDVQRRMWAGLRLRGASRRS